ncbi:hypothetical protein PMG11_09910 [Penicillium brasilianum]|uniref:Retroviral polymerase SH3-like domain-containing protein n=1 Tax=Penicillium brasilianum TaxID=104259 RepID=A0A0F7U128_PENBI|nr:hypothetical protein PMG11_09910 [Penicillium brasilianum]
MARQMTQGAGLPSYLWNEASLTAIYIQNRIPHRSLDWKSPSEALADYLRDKAPHWLKRLPDLSNIRVFGCKAFVRINNIPKLAKMSPRAAIGYLVGYDASNIWRIWIPSKRRIVRARDVEFDETRFYSDEIPPHRIEIIDDSSQLLLTLDDLAATRILDEIDLPEPANLANQEDLLEDQPSQGGVGSNSVDQLDDLDQFAPDDQILGDLPLTPVEQKDAYQSDEALDPDINVPDRPPSPVVLIDNSDFDYSTYLPSSLGKHDRDDSSDNDHDDKRHRALTAFYHAFSAN